MSQASGSIEVLDSSGRWEPKDGLLLNVDDLQVEFRTRYGVAKAINGVSFDLRQSETLAILGESGSGKSVTAQAIMGILDSPPGFVTGGAIRYCGTDILALPEDQRRRIRGPEISMVFQDALSSLNPVFPVGWQIAEMFRKHRGMNRTSCATPSTRSYGEEDPMSPTSGSVEVLDSSGLWQPKDGLLLEVEDLQVEFRTRYGIAKTINGVSFDLRQGETLGHPRGIRLGQVCHGPGHHGHSRLPAGLRDRW